MYLVKILLYVMKIKVLLIVLKMNKISTMLKNIINEGESVKRNRSCKNGKTEKWMS